MPSLRNPQSNDVIDAIQDAAYLYQRTKDIDHITKELMKKGYGKSISKQAAIVAMDDEKYARYLQSLNKDRLIILGISILIAIGLCGLYVYYVQF